MTPLWVPGTHRQNTEPWPIGSCVSPEGWRCTSCGWVVWDGGDTCTMCAKRRYPGATIPYWFWVWAAFIVLGIIGFIAVSLL